MNGSTTQSILCCLLTRLVQVASPSLVCVLKATLCIQILNLTTVDVHSWLSISHSTFHSVLSATLSERCYKTMCQVFTTRAYVMCSAGHHIKNISCRHARGGISGLLHTNEVRQMSVGEVSALPVLARADLSNWRLCSNSPGHKSLDSCGRRFEPPLCWKDIVQCSKVFVVDVTSSTVTGVCAWREWSFCGVPKFLGRAPVLVSEWQQSAATLSPDKHEVSEVMMMSCARC